MRFTSVGMRSNTLVRRGVPESLFNRNQLRALIVNLDHRYFDLLFDAFHGK